MNRILLAVLLLGVCALASSQTFPSKTVHLISGVSPGAASDTMARVLSEKLAASLGQPVIVENKLGAGGVVAAKYVGTAEPDGHNISIYTSAFTIAPILNPGTLDPATLRPVAMLGMVPTALVVNPGKYKTLAELVAAAKAKPGELIAANAGIGSSTHMNLERFRLAAGITFLNLPMKGPAEAITEVLTGRADLYFAPVFSAEKFVQAGTLRVLAVGSPKRSALFPNLPTTLEAGFPNSDYNFWIGALVSSRTPPEIVQRLYREFNAALQLPDVKERMQTLGVEPLPMTLEEFEGLIRKELEENTQLVKAAGIKPN
ncbi:MAG: tripartite tricarboxylate transporter substrate-binding protein [Betaproteobacteria bacterium]